MALAAIEDAVRKADYDRFLSALFAPAAARANLIALYAFNHEIAKTAETVSQPTLGLIHLQWWRETVNGIYAGAVRQHAVAQALATTVSAHDLPRALLDAMIDAREADLEETPFGNIAALEAYADATSGHLMRLAARVLGAGDSLDESAREAGIAYALMGLLRALPFRAARRQLVLPMAALRDAELSTEQVFSGKSGKELAAIIAEIAKVALAHYRTASAGVPRRFLPALLPATLVPLHLKVMTRPDFDPFRDAVEIALPRRQFAMLGAMLRGRI